jgi:hypothetical protein
MISHENITTCPHCHVAHELASGLGHDHKPTQGSVSLCIRCGKASIFTEDLQLRKPTANEKAALTTNKLITSAQIFIAAQTGEHEQEAAGR